MLILLRTLLYFSSSSINLFTSVVIYLSKLSILSLLLIEHVIKLTSISSAKLCPWFIISSLFSPNMSLLFPTKRHLYFKTSRPVVSRDTNFIIKFFFILFSNKKKVYIYCDWIIIFKCSIFDSIYNRSFPNSSVSKRCRVYFFSFLIIY